MPLFYPKSAPSSPLRHSARPSLVLRGSEKSGSDLSTVTLRDQLRYMKTSAYSMTGKCHLTFEFFGLQFGRGESSGVEEFDTDEADRSLNEKSSAQKHYEKVSNI